MTQFFVLRCDICTKELFNFNGEPKNLYKTNGSPLLDLCDECNAPLNEALRRRIAELADK